MFLLRRLFGGDRLRGPATAEVRRLVAATRFELVPMKGVDEAIEALPEMSSVSVTCSPAKGIPATLDLTARLLDLGHHPVPHISARMVEGPDEVFKLAAWFREHGLRDLFVVAGDADQPHGPYDDGLTFLRDLLDHDHGLDADRRPGVPRRSPAHRRRALAAWRAARQAGADRRGRGRRGSTSTQMCFDPVASLAGCQRSDRTVSTLPIHLGVPGVVDRAKLMRWGRVWESGRRCATCSKNRATGRADARPGRLRPDRPRRAPWRRTPDRSASSASTRSRSTASPTRAMWQRAALLGDRRDRTTADASSSAPASSAPSVALELARSGRSVICVDKGPCAGRRVDQLLGVDHPLQLLDARRRADGVGGGGRVGGVGEPPRRRRPRRDGPFRPHRQPDLLHRRATTAPAIMALWDDIGIPYERFDADRDPRARSRGSTPGATTRRSASTTRRSPTTPTVS